MNPLIYSRPMWTPDEAMPLLRALETSLACIGWHVALGGSVLIYGQSYKDLDAIVYSHNDQVEPDSRPVLDMLSRLGFSNFTFCAHGQYQDTKEVWQSTFDNRRVDFIFPQLNAPNALVYP